MNAQELQEKVDRIRENYPQLVRRYERAATIYKSNHFRTIEDDEQYLMVPSSTVDNVAHLVRKVGPVVTCTCKDWQNNAPAIKGIKYCKHIIAAHLLWANGVYEEEAGS